MKKNLNIFDILLIVFVLLALMCFGAIRFSKKPSSHSDEGLYDSKTFVRIACRGIIKSVPLPPPGGDSFYYYVKPGFKVEISSVGVRVAESDCLRKICVHTGIISRPGENIVCVPNKIILSIEQDKDKGDFIIDNNKYHDAVTQ